MFHLDAGGAPVGIEIQQHGLAIGRGIGQGGVELGLAAQGDEGDAASATGPPASAAVRGASALKIMAAPATSASRPMPLNSLALGLLTTSRAPR